MWKENDRGFTLVELAIVMSIIGLLIGGILKGQELLENARVVQTAAQVKSYDAATTAFRDIYHGLPGDLASAAEVIEGCNVNCALAGNPSVVDYGKGDNLIGDTALAYYKTNQMPLQNPPSHKNQESLLFWIHLLKAKLITGVNDSSLHGTVPVAWGVTHPEAKAGGGFIVSSGSRGSSGMVPGSPKMFPFELILIPRVNADLTSLKSEGILTPGRAAQIDRKIDDGKPASGHVKALGLIDSCFAPGDNGEYIYDESITSKDCGLVFRIQ